MFRSGLAAGEAVVGYTDGVTEAMNTEGQLFSEQRLQDAVRTYWTGTSEEIVQGISAAVLGFAKGAPQSDDITVLALRFLGDEHGQSA